MNITTVLDCIFAHAIHDNDAETEFMMNVVQVLPWHQAPMTMKVALSEFPDALSLEQASSTGNLALLDVWVAVGPDFTCPDRAAIDAAAGAGQIAALEWWLALARTRRTNFGGTWATATEASRNGHVAVLEWLYTRSRLLETTVIFDVYSEARFEDLVIDEDNYDADQDDYFDWELTPTAAASANNRVSVLDWWWSKRAEFPFFFDVDMVSVAMERRHLDVLHWFDRIRTLALGDDIIIDYSNANLRKPSGEGQIEALAWWKQQYLDKKVSRLIPATRSPIQAAVRANQIAVATWWWDVCQELAVPFPVGTNLVDHAVSVEMLDWLLQKHTDHGMPFEYTEEAVANASKHRSVRTHTTVPNPTPNNPNRATKVYHADDAAVQGTQALDWWWRAHTTHGLAFKYDERAIDWADQDLSHGIHDWWLQRNLQDGLKLKYSEEAMDHATDCQALEVMSWFEMLHERHGLEIKHSEGAVIRAAHRNQLLALDWWAERRHRPGFEFLFTTEATDGMCTMYTDTPTVTLDWFWDAQEKYGIELDYTSWAVAGACSKAKLDILDWWWVKHVEFGIEFKLDMHDIEWPRICKKYPQVTAWFLGHGFRDQLMEIEDVLQYI
ncbi:hypothetical protein BC828DRAFT_412937 [Blastocladiella britannica]|nr:hypothetical protein BC828DRAFT_412937 [Blastocladiella britannica]